MGLGRQHQCFQTSGDVVALGNQKTTFGLRWAENAKKLDYVRDTDPYLPAETFFRKILGAKSYRDIDYNGRAKITLDLGQPIPESLHNSADFLFDGGTVEHIPNVYQAVKNAMLMLRVGGMYFTQNPITCYADCYHNLTALFWRDFLGANGFKMVDSYYYYIGGIHGKLPRWIHLVKQNWMPPFLVDKCKAKNAEQTEAGRSWMQDILNADNPKKRVVIPCFTEKSMQRVFRKGLPVETAICYIAIKTRELSPSSIVDSVQEIYPNIIKTPHEDSPLYPSAILK